MRKIVMLSLPAAAAAVFGNKNGDDDNNNFTRELSLTLLLLRTMSGRALVVSSCLQFEAGPAADAAVSPEKHLV